MAKRIGKDTVMRRASKLLTIREEMLKNVDNLHVKLQPGNNKTGKNCYTVSLAPIVDCINCGECMWNCYDIRNDVRFPNVYNDRAKNSAIHKMDSKRYWNEISMQVKVNAVRELRINVGGDLNDDDFQYVAKIGRENPKTRILFFTKNYKGINKYLEHHRFPKNVRPIMSAWEGMEMDNPNKLPCSHVLYEDGRTTAPEYGAVYCGGNCSECACEDKGCWTLKKNEHVVFKAH